MRRPIDYNAQIAKWTEGFTGRGWLFTEVEDFLSSQAGVMLITGEPGIGKTAFAAQLVKEKGYLHYFINAQLLEWVSPTTMIKTIAAQIAALYGGDLLDGGAALPELNVNMEIGAVESGAVVTGVHIEEFVSAPVEEEYLRQVIDPLNVIVGQNTEPIFVLDGLEDADSFSGKPTIADLILSSGGEFPGKLIITSTHDRAVDMITRSFPEDRIFRIDIQGEMSVNLRDCRDYVSAVIEGLQNSDGSEESLSSLGGTVDEICLRAEGNFLYLRTFLDELRESGGKTLVIDEIPQGLHRIYLDQLSKLTQEDFDKWFEVLAPIFGILSVARAPLTIEQMSQYSQISRGSIQMAVKELARYLDFNPDEAFSRRGYSLYHTALGNFIVNPDLAEEFFIPSQEQHKRIADSIHEKEADLANMEDDYAINNLSYHNRMAGAECRQRLLAMIDPEIQHERRLRFKSDQIFRQDIAEAILAALSAGLPEGIPELVRCGLIDAGIVSKVANVPADVLRELAQGGEWQRAISLAHTGTGRTSEGLASIVSGILDSDREDRIDLSIQICRQIEGFGEDAVFAARSHAEVGNALAKNGDSSAEVWFRSALNFIEGIPDDDERARILALIGSYWSLIDNQTSGEMFDRSLQAARAMEETLDPDIRDNVVSNNMAAQSFIQSEWSASQTHFDTLGAKARVLADIAVSMAAAGDARAGEVLEEAEDVAAHIGGSGIQDGFARITREYINGRRKIVTGQEPLNERTRLKPRDVLENQIESSEKMARDQKGYYPRALIAIVKAMIPINWKQAGEVMTRAEQAADHAEGGYRAQLLLELAKLRRLMGQTQAGEALEQRAVQAAKSHPDFLEGYEEWLASKGKQVAISLREVASVRHGLAKREFHSDQALANMALGLATQSPEDARTLAENIQDRSQRFRALAGIAASLDHTEAAKLVDDILEHSSGEEGDFILLQSCEAISVEYPEMGNKLANGINDPAKRILAWMGIVDTFDENDQAKILESAWELSLTIDQGSAILAEGMLKLGSHFLISGDSRAENCYQRAIDAAHEEPSLSKRADVLCKIAAKIGENDPALGKELLAQCAGLGRKLSGVRARGRILGVCVALAMRLDPENACQLLAEVRYLGRANFLDAVSQMVEPMVERFGAAYAWKLYGALQEAEKFS